MNQYEINPSDTLRPSPVTEAISNRVEELGASTVSAETAYLAMYENNDTHQAAHDRLLQSALIGQRLAKKTDYLSDVLETDVAPSYRREAAAYNTQLTPQQITDVTNHVKAVQAQTEKLKAHQPQPTERENLLLKSRERVRSAALNSNAALDALFVDDNEEFALGKS